MSRHKRLPDISQIEFLPSQKSKNKYSSISTPQGPVIIKPNLETRHHKIASVNYDSPYRNPGNLTRVRSSSSIKLNDRNQSKTKVISPSLKKNASNSSLQLKFKRSRSNKSVSHPQISHQQSQSYIEPYQPHILRNRNHSNANLSFNTSFTSLTAPTQDSQRPRNHTSHTSTEVQELEAKLSENLKALKQKENSECMSGDKIEVYRKIFGEVIDRDKTYGNILVKIKCAYEELIQVIKNNGNSLQLQQEIADVNDKVKQLTDERKVIFRKIEKLARENAELSRSLDENEARYNELQEKLCLISKTNVEAIPKDEISWKFLVAENQNFLEICKQMKSEMRNFRSKERKLLKLVMAMKKRGYPVEEVYENDVVKRRKIERHNDSEKPENESEEELIVSGPLKSVNKPAIVPNLKLDNVQPDLSSESSESDSDFTGSEESKNSSEIN